MQQAYQALRVLLSTSPTSPYADDLLRPFYSTCSAGHAAAVRTIAHLRLDRCEGLPYSRQLWLLEAADHATAVTVTAGQIQGLLKAAKQQQQQQLQRDVAALGATLNTILAMEGSCAGAPYVTATTSTSSITTSSSMGIHTASPSTPLTTPAAAAKPRTTRLTHFIVDGAMIKPQVEQLVQLLDMLPCTQHLRHLVLKNMYTKEVYWQIQATPSWSPWPIGCIKSGADEEPFMDFLASKQPSNSLHATSCGGKRCGGASCASCHDASSSDTGGSSSSSSWRSSCHTVQWWFEEDISMILLFFPAIQPLLEALQQLRGLFLVGPNVADLPRCVPSLQQLRSLHFSKVAGTPQVLQAIAGLTNLRSLGITQCSLTAVPAAFTALVRLTHLDLSVTSVTSDGLECLGDMSSLKELDLSSCMQCIPIPNSISRLTGLESIIMNESPVTFLPEFFTALPKLCKLAWSEGTYFVPLQLDPVWRLRGLQQLLIVDHTMATLPAAVGQLTQLTALMVMGARLAHLPDSLSRLVGLERVAFLSPSLRMLPETITALTKLTAIDVHSVEALALSPAVRAFVQPRLYRAAVAATAAAAVTCVLRLVCCHMVSLQGLCC
jgi:Leucine-rich repeat (LRR) protein